MLASFIGTSNVGAFTLQVSGSFGATTKSFIIDHPTKAGKKLMYGSLESPYHGIRLTGRDTLVNGKCKVELPDYMYKLILHDSINIQLTGIKCNKTLYVDDINNELIASYKRLAKKQDSLIALDSIQLDKQDSIIVYQKNIVTDLEKKIELLQPKWNDKKSVWFGFGFITALGSGILVNQLIK